MKYLKITSFVTDVSTHKIVNVNIENKVCKENALKAHSSNLDKMHTYTHTHTLMHAYSHASLSLIHKCTPNLITLTRNILLCDRRVIEEIKMILNFDCSDWQ